MQRFEGTYIMNGFQLSHKLLLFRHSDYLEDGSSSNIDVIFQGLFYTECPTLIQNPLISKASKKEFMDIQAKLSIKLTAEYQFIFRIESSERKYYVGAKGLWISHNNLHPDETSFHLKPSVVWNNT